MASCDGALCGKKDGDIGDVEDLLIPEVTMFGPHNVRDLVQGEKYLWCACGKSEKRALWSVFFKKTTISSFVA